MWFTLVIHCRSTNDTILMTPNFPLGVVLDRLLNFMLEIFCRVLSRIFFTNCLVCHLTEVLSSSVPGTSFILFSWWGIERDKRKTKDENT